MKTFKYKLYNADHNRQLRKQLSIACNIYNHCIALHKRFYHLTGKYIHPNDLKKHITKLKRLDKYSHWNRLNSQTIQDVVERIDKGYQLFFKKKARNVPKFKGWRNYKSITFKQTGYKILGNRTIKILNKKYKYFDSRPIEGNIKTITVKRDSLGDFYFCITTDYEQSSSRVMTGKTAGFDFGLKTFLVNSDGTEIESPEFLKKSLDILASSQRKLSSGRKGSNNRNRSRLSVARVHRKIANQRRDWHHKTANILMSKYDELYFETLNLDGMKRLWGRKVSDLGFNSFLTLLEQKCLQNNVVFHKTDRFEPTTKECHYCGFKNQNITLDDREWTCPKCDTWHDRDVNAAKNILAIGTKKKETITGRALPVRGEGVKLYDSKSRVAHVGVLREKRVGTLVDTKNPI